MHEHHRSGSAARKRKAGAPQARALKPRLASSASRRPTAANLLALPDEALSQIFKILMHAKSRSSKRRSSAAFALAASHTRLFRVFAAFVTHITTDEDFYHQRYVFLYRASFLPYILEKGDHGLRCLHLDALHCGLLKHLSTFCPRLEVFSVASPHDCTACCDTLKSFLALRLRSLRITVNSKRVLRAITTPPPELTLRMTDTFPEEMKHIASLSLNRVTLQFSFVAVKKGLTERLIRDFMPQLLDLCSRTTELSITVSYRKWIGRASDILTPHEARRRFDSVKMNDAKLPCRSISLSGESLFPLLRNVNPNASIQLTCGDVTFAQEKGVTYAKKIPLWPLFLNTDISRLQEVVIARRCHRRWANILSGRHLSRALVSNLQMASFLNLYIDTVCIEACHIQGTDWGWLSRARELHILIPSGWKPLELRSLLEGLPHMLDSFGGFRCWIHDLTEYKYIVPIPNTSDDDDDDDDGDHDPDDYLYQSRRDRPRRYRPSSYDLTGAFMDSLERRLRIGNPVVEELAVGLQASFTGLKRFEERGGDGQSIRAMLEDVRRFLFTEFGKEVF